MQKHYAEYNKTVHSIEIQYCFYKRGYIYILFLLQSYLYLKKKSKCLTRLPPSYSKVLILIESSSNNSVHIVNFNIPEDFLTLCS